MNITRYYINSLSYLFDRLPREPVFLCNKAARCILREHLSLKTISYATAIPNSLQDTLNLTLGRDKRIVVRKEKVADYSSVKFLGANKKEVFAYQITVKNNKKEKIQLLLKDQYPISSSKEIEEEWLESSGASVNKDTGILTWEDGTGCRREPEIQGEL